MKKCVLFVVKDSSLKDQVTLNQSMNYEGQMIRKLDKYQKIDNAY